MKPLLLFCTGLSGSGKSYFADNILPAGAFYKLKSATTREMREGEKDGREYYFRDESYFESEKFVTHLFVNESFWTPGKPKWLYGVPEFEVFEHLGQNLVYDVIQPRYVREMIEWFKRNKLAEQYKFKILRFLPPANNFETAKKRQNMPNDMEVRKTNTCDRADFEKVGFVPYNKVVHEVNTYTVLQDIQLMKLINQAAKLQR